MMQELRFGTAGIPISTPERNTLNGISYVRELKLDAMELEFVRSINVTEEAAPEIKQIAKKKDVVLTCHAPYYINLNSLEKPKIHASMKRILDSARIANACGAWSVCFHAGFYMKEAPARVYDIIKKYMKEIIKTLKHEQNKIWIRPETTGKGTQFGSLQEILRLSEELEQVMPCIDFSHLFARSVGELNTIDDFSEMLKLVERSLGKQGLDNMHIHVSGIDFGEKGEKKHLTLKESDFNYRALMQTFKEFKVKGVVISESPNIEEDALLMQKTFGGTR